MDYEKKLALAKEALDSGSYDKETIEYIFPELKESEESEDERIRKAIINVFATHKDYEIFFGVSVEDILAWLEKQDQSSSKVHYWTEEEIEPIINDYLTGAEHYGGMIGRLRCLKPKSLEKQGKNNMGISEATKQELEDNLNKALEKETPESWNKFLDEQQPVDKIEPKFNVGEWIIFNENHNSVYQVERIDNCRYYLRHLLGGTFSVHFDNELIRAWTIQDAKEGDVLYFNDGHGNDCIELIKSITNKKIEFWFCLTNGNRYEVFDGNIPYTNLVSREDATPATKEQRDLLFQKIKDEGYDWDAEKKELRKIEQQPAWSEEDGENFNWFENFFRAESVFVEGKNIPQDRYLWFKNLKDRVQPQPKQEWSEEDENAIGMAIIALDDLYDEDSPDTTYAGYNLPFNKAAERLKSLKDRVGCEVDCTTTKEWKPSDEQIEVLTWCLPLFVEPRSKAVLQSLINDLKKLKEE